MTAVFGLQQRPQLGVGSAQFVDRFRRDLTRRQHLARESSEAVTVMHPPPAEALTGGWRERN